MYGTFAPPYAEKPISNFFPIWMFYEYFYKNFPSSIFFFQKISQNFIDSA